jgi:hypothetical protein
MHIYDKTYFNPSYNEKCFRQKLEKESKRAFYVQLLFPENRAIYEITWKNIVHVQPDRPQMTKYNGASALRSG